MSDQILEGWCQCGCGQQTKIAKQTRLKGGVEKGHPSMFVKGHQNRKPPREEVYRKAKVEDHPDRLNYKRAQIDEHIAIVEHVLGKPLPIGAIVHHANGKRGDNRNSNLVVCQDWKYHMLLHQRMRALAACGNPNYWKCQFCQTWSDPTTMYPHSVPVRFAHKECYLSYHRIWEANKKARAAA